MQIPPGSAWPTAPDWAPGPAPVAPQPLALPQYPPAWPAAYGAVPHPGPVDDSEYAAAVAAAEAAEARSVVAGNGHLDGLPPGRIKVIERFQGPRLKHRTSLWRRFRSFVLLLVIGVLMAAVLATVLAMIVWGISVGVHAATTG